VGGGRRSSHFQEGGVPHPGGEKEDKTITLFISPTERKKILGILLGWGNSLTTTKSGITNKKTTKIGALPKE